MVPARNAVVARAWFRGELRVATSSSGSTGTESSLNSLYSKCMIFSGLAFLQNWPSLKPRHNPIVISARTASGTLTFLPVLNSGVCTVRCPSFSVMSYRRITTFHNGLKSIQERPHFIWGWRGMWFREISVQWLYTKAGYGENPKAL